MSKTVNDAGATDFGIQPALSPIKSAGGSD